MENKIIELLCEYKGFNHWWHDLPEVDQDIILEDMHEMLAMERLREGL